MAMSEQLALPLPPLRRFGRADFLPAAANRAALAFIESWPDWPAPVLVLSGPEGSGKSHLAAIWQARSGAIALSPEDLERQMVRELLHGEKAVVLEDIERALGGNPALEAKLYALFQVLNERQGFCLMTARQPAAAWPVALPDLASRLRGAAAAAMAEPDDALIEAVLVKQMSDRQMPVQPGVPRYLAMRMERSLTAVAHLVEALDRAALAQRKGTITQPFAASVLRARQSQGLD